jgi:hypothetical protein
MFETLFELEAIIACNVRNIEASYAHSMNMLNADSIGCLPGSSVYPAFNTS